MRKRILYITCMLLLFSTVLQLTSCYDYGRKTGIEKFNENNSDFGLCHYLIPTDFLSLFPYESGDYTYTFEEVLFYYRVDVALIYMVYDEETYKEAKEYAFRELPLSKEIFAKYNSFIFHSNIDSEKLLKIQTFFAYSDEKRTLIAFGMYDYQANKLYNMEMLWGVYLKQYFPYYDWDS